MIKDILQYPHPTLVATNELIIDVSEVKHVLDDLHDTLTHRNDAIGLSAPQIGYNYQIFTLNVFGAIEHYLNPIITSGKNIVHSRERCMSLDDVYSVKRYDKIYLQWMTPDYEIRIMRFNGYYAHVIQHEIDHLNARLINRGKKIK